MTIASVIALLIVIAAYVALTRWILPRFGVQT
jgi:hypothetical protein